MVECLESSDETLKRETLELLYKMTNQDNIEFIIQKLMEQLRNTNDQFFKKDMVNKILALIEKYAPTQEWFLDTTLELIEHASEHITNEILNDQLRLFYDLVENDEEFTLYVLNAFMTKTVSDDLSDPYVKICAWILG